MFEKKKIEKNLYEKLSRRRQRVVKKKKPANE